MNLRGPKPLTCEGEVAHEADRTTVGRGSQPRPNLFSPECPTRGLPQGGKPARESPISSSVPRLRRQEDRLSNVVYRRCCAMDTLACVPHPQRHDRGFAYCRRMEPTGFRRARHTARFATICRACEVGETAEGDRDRTHPGHGGRQLDGGLTPQRH